MSEDEGYAMFVPIDDAPRCCLVLTNPSPSASCSKLKLPDTCCDFHVKNSQHLVYKGVARGTHMGPSYACLFIGYEEQSLFRSYTGPIPHLFLCYIDDCFGAASCSHEELEQFITFTNTFHPNLKFTWTISDTSFSFLDLSVSISGDHLKTYIYFKPINSHSYLDYTSSHPPSCKNAIPY
eukprot:g45402.t1